MHSALGIHDLLCVKNLDVLSFEYAASPSNIEAVPKSMLEKADKQIRVGISRTDIDSILAELYEKDVIKPSAQQLVESDRNNKEKIQSCQRKIRRAIDVYGS